MTRMFPFITKTWNPLGGECHHNCPYCWAKRLIKRHHMVKYEGPARLIHTELKRQFKATDFVFVCDMCDLFGSWVPKTIIQWVLGYIGKSPATFLLLTKNPKRYLEFQIPKNAVCGTTIETDMVLDGWHRIEVMRQVKARKMVSVEPIIDFSDKFPYAIVSVNPEFVAVGYDNYESGLLEPPLAKTMDLIAVLKDWQIQVYEKTLREKMCLVDGERNSAGE